MVVLRLGEIFVTRLGRAPRGGGGVIALIPAIDVVEEGPGGAVVLPGVVAVVEVVLQPALDGGGGQGVLNAGARHGPHLVLPHGVHQQEAVVPLRVADAAPVLRHRHGVVGGVHAVHEVHRHHHDLAAGGLEEGLVLVDDVLLGLLTEHVGVVGHIEGVGGLHHRAGRAGEQGRPQQGGGQQLFHGFLSSHWKISAGWTKVSVPRMPAGKPPSTRVLKSSAAAL